MPKTQAARAAYIRRWRENNYKDKRFNKPLREYIEIKYGDIYNEYCSFFKSLDEQHPSAKDLTKTRAYKNWKSAQLNCESSEDESDTAEPELDHTEPELDPAEPELDHTEPELDHTEPELDPTEPEFDPAEPELDPTEPDVLTVALEETLSPVVNDINFDINEVDNIIEQLINEFEQDDAIRDLLNQNNNELVHPHYQDEDEGIGLNVETELEDILEPFDYNLEVEGFEF